MVSWEKARKPHSLLWGGMASGGLGAVAPIMAFSLEDAPQLAAGFFIERRENSCKKVNALTTPF
jgi:hypothetical protein